MTNEFCLIFGGSGPGRTAYAWRPAIALAGKGSLTSVRPIAAWLILKTMEYPLPEWSLKY